MAARLANLSPEKLKFAQLAFACAGVGDIILGLAFAFFGPVIIADPEIEGFLYLAGLLIALMGVGILFWAYKVLPQSSE